MQPELQQTSALLELDKVSVSYGARTVLDNVTFTVPKGKIVAIMGPSGIGKTTLLSTISCLRKPDSGRVLFNGVDLHSLQHKVLFKMRARLGYMFQHGALFGQMSVFDNVAFPLRENTALPASMIRDIVLMKLEVVGLRGVAHLMPASLSGGMARRVAMARALALDPDLMLYDEPFTGQDPISVGVLTSLIKKMRDTLGLSAVIVSHDSSAVAKVADIVHIISGGTFVATGTVDEIFSSDQTMVKQFVSGMPDGPIPFHYPAKTSLTEDLVYV